MFVKAQKFQTHFCFSNVPCISFLSDLSDGGTSLADDVLVKLLEDRDLHLVVTLQEVFVDLVDGARALVHVILRPTELDDVRVRAKIGERDLKKNKI